MIKAISPDSATFLVTDEHGTHIRQVRNGRHFHLGGRKYKLQTKGLSMRILANEKVVWESELPAPDESHAATAAGSGR